MMTDATTNQPQDFTLGIGDDHLTTFGPETDFLVGQIVAHKLRTVHTEGYETVARLDDTDGQRKFNLFFINRYAII